MNGFAALCAFIAAFSPPMGEIPITPTQGIVQTADELNHLQMQDLRIDDSRIHGVIYFDGPILNPSHGILR